LVNHDKEKCENRRGDHGIANSGVNTLTGERLAEVLTISEHEAAQVERERLEFVKRFTTITTRTARSRGTLR
jgi:hypothetical protein